VINAQYVAQELQCLRPDYGAFTTVRDVVYKCIDLTTNRSGREIGHMNACQSAVGKVKVMNSHVPSGCNNFQCCVGVQFFPHLVPIRPWKLACYSHLRWCALLHRDLIHYLFTILLKCRRFWLSMPCRPNIDVYEPDLKGKTGTFGGSIKASGSRRSRKIAAVGVPTRTCVFAILFMTGSYILHRFG
jgi:hypothetical protein